MRRSLLVNGLGGAKMTDFPIIMKDRLLGLIEQLSNEKHQYVKEPERDFIRNRKLPFQSMVYTMLSLGGKSIGNELLEHFEYDVRVATSSAFIQKRSKLLPNVFSTLLHKFTNDYDKLKTYDGYRLVAVDGSDLLIPHDPNSDSTYFQSMPDSKGFNLVHVNAMYDVLNRIYLDATVQPGRNENEFRALTDMVDASQIEDPVLLIADRGYESYNVFAHIMEKGWKFLIRIKDAKSKSMLSTFNLPEMGEFDRQI